MLFSLSFSMSFLDLILNSIEKTNRAIVVHEDNLTGGFGGEISSLINEHAFELLDAPIMRLGSLDTPIPFSSNIEKDVYFPVKNIDKTIKKLLDY